MALAVSVGPVNTPASRGVPLDALGDKASFHGRSAPIDKTNNGEDPWNY